MFNSPSRSPTKMDSLLNEVDPFIRNGNKNMSTHQKGLWAIQRAYA
jgi:hypothetical protein